MFSTFENKLYRIDDWFLLMVNSLVKLQNVFVSLSNLFLHSALNDDYSFFDLLPNYYGIAIIAQLSPMWSFLFIIINFRYWFVWCN